MYCTSFLYYKIVSWRWVACVKALKEWSHTMPPFYVWHIGDFLSRETLLSYTAKTSCQVINVTTTICCDQGGRMKGYKGTHWGASYFQMCPRLCLPLFVTLYPPKMGQSYREGPALCLFRCPVCSKNHIFDYYWRKGHFASEKCSY